MLTFPAILVMLTLALITASTLIYILRVKPAKPINHPQKLLSPSPEMRVTQFETKSPRLLQQEIRWSGAHDDWGFILISHELTDSPEVVYGNKDSYHSDKGYISQDCDC